MVTSQAYRIMRNVIFYGVPAGLISIGTIILGLQSESKAASSEMFGYLSMLIALSLVFLGVKRYRDQELGGIVSFVRALILGLLISLAAGVAYSLVWEVYISITGSNYIEPYLKGILDSKIADGMAGEELDTLKLQLDEMRASYNNPFKRMFITFTEIFPVGALVSLVSAGLLRKPTFLPLSFNSR